MRSSLWLGIFVLVCCILFVAESKSLGSTNAFKQRKIIRIRRDIFGFSFSDVAHLMAGFIGAFMKSFVDSILNGLPVIG
ncbi:unnamed protein product [Larinioides sclopetarius]|uniref:Uncharacterized protein n=1 Tax=Larinioides sclopetarius TaxID=280406 RepID=A0AAV2AHD2_9ARAC